MTSLYLTIDTEYSPGHFRRSGKAARVENFARSIVARGHDVQLHLHGEWLEFAGAFNPLTGLRGRDIKDFTVGQQCKLLDYARGILVAAGAPAPIAFRAGNYAANDDTLRALAAVGMRYDTSHCPGIAGSDCAISLGAHDRDPIEHCGVTEVPIGCIGDRGGTLRHFQLTALTDVEIIAALRHAARQDRSSMTLVSHSFELLSRDRLRVNRIVKHRFERMCAVLEATPGISSATYACQPPLVGTDWRPYDLLPYSVLRTVRRYVEQALSNTLYGSR